MLNIKVCGYKCSFCGIWGVRRVVPVRYRGGILILVSGERNWHFHPLEIYQKPFCMAIARQLDKAAGENALLGQNF